MTLAILMLLFNLVGIFFKDPVAHKSLEILFYQSLIILLLSLLFIDVLNSSVFSSALLFSVPLNTSPRTCPSSNNFALTFQGLSLYQLSLK
jgi:hypothetical protein